MLEKIENLIEIYNDFDGDERTRERLAMAIMDFIALNEDLLEDIKEDFKDNRYVQDLLNTYNEIY